MADHEARELAPAARPAGAALGQRHRVKAPARHLHPDVARVGVDGDPPPGPGVSPVLEVAGDHRRADQPRGRQRVADRARAVVTVGVEGGVTAAVDVGERGDRVAGGDHLGHRRGGPGGGLHHPAGVDGDPGDAGVAGRRRARGPAAARRSSVFRRRSAPVTGAHSRRVRRAPGAVRCRSADCSAAASFRW